MLSDADPRERAVLGAIGYAPNTVYLHRDIRLMPKRRRAWASWNFLRWQREGTAENDVAVTYWMNRLAGHRREQAAVRQPQPSVRTGSGADVRQIYAAIIRNITPRPSQPRSNWRKFRAGVTPGSAAPGPDTDFTRTDCGPVLRSRKRWARPCRGAHLRPNWHRPRSSDAEANRQTRNRSRYRGPRTETPRPRFTLAR